MKRPVRILSLAMLLLLLASQLVFASDLKVVDITPSDGKKGMQTSNMAVKVTFNEPMVDEKAIEANESKFKITNPAGEEQPFRIVYSEEKYPDQLWLILEYELVSDTEYNFEILPGVVSKNGSTLAEGMKTTFKTRNTKTDQRISTLLMFGMMGVMFYATSKATKKAAEEQNGGVAPEAKQYNPYKLAKEKGISVDEAKALIAKEKEKDARKAAKYAESQKQKDEAMAAEVDAIQKRLEEEYEAARHAANYQVKGPRSIKDAGIAVPRSVVKQNKAKREAAEKAEKARERAKKK